MVARARQGKKFGKPLLQFTRSTLLLGTIQVEKDKFVRGRTGIFFIGIYLVEALIRQLGG